MLRAMILGTVAVMGVTGAAVAQEWGGQLEFGLSSTQRSSTERVIDEDPFHGHYVAGVATASFGALAVAVDGRLEFTKDKGLDDVYNSGPLQAGVLGLHVGHNFGPLYAGGYGGIGFFDGFDKERPMRGSALGIDLGYAVSPMLNLTGQVGYAEAIGSVGDNEYKGYTVKVGVNAKVNEQIGLNAMLETGRSEDCFVDCGNQPAAYFGLSLGADFAVTDKVTIVGSVSQTRINDYDDPDTGKDVSVFLGARYAFGRKPDAATPTMPITAFRAAGWMHPLD